jgi:exonuclease SbcC
MAETARKVLAMLSSELEALSTKAAEAVELARQADELAKDHAAAQVRLTGLEAGLEQAEAAHETASKVLTDVNAALEKALQVKKDQAGLVQDIADRQYKLEKVQDEIQSGLDWLKDYEGREKEIAAAGKKVEAIGTKLMTMRTEREALLKELSALSTNDREASAAVGTARGRVLSMERELDKAKEAAALLEKLGDVDVDAHKKAVAKLEKALDKAQREHEEHAALWDKQHGLKMKLEAVQERIDEASKQAAVLDGVPCEAKGKYSGCQLIAGAVERRDSITELEAQSKALDEEVIELAVDEGAVTVHSDKMKDIDPQLTKARTDLNTAQDMATKFAATKVLAEQVPALVKAVDEAQTEMDAAGFVVAEITGKQRSVQKTADDLSHKVTGLEREQSQLRKLAEIQPYIEKALAEIATRREQETDLEKALSALQAKVEAVPDTESLNDAYRVAQDEGREIRLVLKQSRDDVADVARELAGLAGRMEQIGDVAQKARTLEQRREALEFEAMAWRVLTGALGKDGIQLLEIDAAGPKVSATANALLSETYGDRFQVRVTTMEARKAPRPGESPYKDVFSLRVMDAERGVEEVLESVSGGQGVILSDAIKDSLAMYMNHQLPTSLETMWADESSAALDADNRASYFERKRKAMAMNGVRQFYLVSHDEEVWASADSLIRTLPGGKVEVC